MTIANLLYKQGHQPIIIDKAHGFSDAGFVLSLKSFGVEIIKEMGLEEKMRSSASKSDFVSFFKPTGNIVRRLNFSAINKSLSDIIMATRANLHRVLYDAVKSNVEIRFGTTIKNVEQTGKEVFVQLSDDSTIRADLLVIAEGSRSTTRDKLWDDVRVEDFNIFYAAGRLNYKHTYETGHCLTYRGVKKVLAVLPLSENELAIQCYIHSTASAESLQKIEKEQLAETFKNFNPEALGLIKKMEEKGEIFSDKIGMVYAPVLHKGRVVLLGDAGYCPTSLSGMGASLSIYGAKALAHYVESFPYDLSKALENYNSLMHPIIQKFQRNTRKNVRTFLPMDKMNLRAINILFRCIPLSFITKRMGNELSLTKSQKNFVID